MHDRALHHALKSHRLHRLGAEVGGQSVQVFFEKPVEVASEAIDVCAHMAKDPARGFVVAEHVEQVLQGEVFVAALLGLTDRREKGDFEIFLNHDLRLRREDRIEVKGGRQAQHRPPCKGWFGVAMFTADYSGSMVTISGCPSRRARAMVVSSLVSATSRG